MCAHFSQAWHAIAVCTTNFSCACLLWSASNSLALHRCECLTYDGRSVSAWITIMHIYVLTFPVTTVFLADSTFQHLTSLTQPLVNWLYTSRDLCALNCLTVTKLVCSTKYETRSVALTGGLVTGSLVRQGFWSGGPNSLENGPGTILIFNRNYNLAMG